MSWQRTCFVSGVLVLAGVAAYFNSFQGEFVYDDIGSIQDNRHIRRIWPLSEAMSLPLINYGATVSRRPILSLSFALNRRLLGPEPWGYHLVNLAIHLVAALLLFGIVRRTLCRQKWVRDFLPGRPKEGFAQKVSNHNLATALALAIALLWMVHPLQTESVTYMVQRAESLMGMLYLLTLYCALRGFDSPRARFWYGGAILACGMGMGVKEVMVTAPILVFLYDGVFVSASYRSAWQQRRKFYTVLASTWCIPLLLLLAGWQNARTDFTDRSPLTYALTQPGVILYYLRLSVWPDPLVMDYNWPDAESVGAIAPAGCVIALLLGVSVWGLYRRHWIGFLGAWFFLILGPSSSFAALTQNLEEHRMYLSLAAVVVLGVFAVGALLRRLPGGLYKHGLLIGAAMVLAVTVLLTLRTQARNRNYHSRKALWTDNIAQRPNSAKAHLSLGILFEKQDDLVRSMAHFWQAIRIDPFHTDAAEAHNSLGIIYEKQGDPDRGMAHFQQAIRIRSDYADAYYNLGLHYDKQDKLEQAAEAFEQALRITPNHANALGRLGHLFQRQKKLDRASAYLKRAVRLRPNDAAAHNNLGMVFYDQNNLRQALYHFERAVGTRPDFAMANYNLGIVFGRLGRPEKAVHHFERAVKADTNYAEAHFNLGVLLPRLGRHKQAIAHLEQAVNIDPKHADAHNNLGALLANHGDLRRAITHFEMAVRINPNHGAKKNLLKAREALKNK